MAGYGDDAGFTAWLADNGYSLPVGAPSQAVLRNRSSNYIDAAYGARFLGSVVDPAQERQWPREGAIVNGKLLPSNVVPAAVINASYEAAYQEAASPGSLSVVGSASSAVKREKVGQLEVEYQSAESDGTASGITPLISIVDGMLAPYLRCEDLVYLGIMSIGGARCD
ncbi:DnaT-like ssDNA-binding protein [Rhizobium sp. ZK1]|uniref:DnaT-like ssDNA-binding protein n=1 Tax=Rhizobium sp. ZK1 TaxID=3389872 RepID=UPI0039F6CC3E